MTRGIRSTSVAVTLVALITACGSSAKTSTPAQDLALAKGAVLTDTDAPLAYKAQPHQASADVPEQVKRDFATCMKTDATVFDNAGKQNADGPDFTDEQGDEIDNSVAVYGKKSELDKRYELMTKQQAEVCLGQLFDTLLKGSSAQNGATFGATSVGRFAVDGVGDRGLGFRATVPVTAEDRSGTEYADVLLAQRGRGGITLVSSGGTAPDHAAEVALAKKMSDRLGQKAP
jgi:hypothetical protein